MDSASPTAILFAPIRIGGVELRNRLVFQPHYTALGTFDTLKIEPWVLWLSEGSFRSQSRETTVWVTDDARHLPVRISSEVFFGSVYADLIQVSGGRAKSAAPEKAAQ